MAAKIKTTFLGTSASTPSIMRNHPSVLISYEDENILVDCGEGTQRQFRKARLNPCKLTRILITHWHGDHVLGLPGLLQSLALNAHVKPLYIYGPKGTKNKVAQMLKVFGFFGTYKIEVKDIVKQGIFFETDGFVLESESMEHGIPTNAYNFVLKDRLRIDKDKIKKLKLKPGKHLKDLKEGKNVEVEGKKYKAKDLTYIDKGKKISVVLDTLLIPAIAKFVKSADVFICEATFDKSLKQQAKEHLHLTSEQAASIAKKAKVGKFYLTHISSRYEPNMKAIRNEAREIFEESYLAKDLDSFEI